MNELTVAQNHQGSPGDWANAEISPTQKPMQLGQRVALPQNDSSSTGLKYSAMSVIAKINVSDVVNRKNLSIGTRGY